MWDENESNALSNLKKRIHLCSRGITLPDEIPKLHRQSLLGFAGPQGTSCYFGNKPGDHSSQIGLVVYPKHHYLAPYALSTKWVEDFKSTEKRKILHVENDTYLEKVPINWKGILPNGKKTDHLSKARYHSYSTFCIGYYWHCRHIDNNEGCKYCTINATIDKLRLPHFMPIQESIDHLQLAISQNPIRSVTLTSGTHGSPEDTARCLLSLARQIRQQTSLSVHVQTEPIFDKALFKDLSEVADSMGIFLEFFDERIRQKICPGKARMNSLGDYFKSWEMAVFCFGKGKVVTTNMIGFNEDYEICLRNIEKAAQIGVTTDIQWLRVGSTSLGPIVPSYIGREDEILLFHQEVGKILVKNSVDSTSSKNSGCLGCHGCNATREAIRWARIAVAKNKEKTFELIPEAKFAQQDIL